MRAKCVPWRVPVSKLSHCAVLHQFEHVYPREGRQATHHAVGIDFFYVSYQFMFSEEESIVKSILTAAEVKIIIHDIKICKKTI